MQSLTNLNNKKKMPDRFSEVLTLPILIGGITNIFDYELLIKRILFTTAAMVVGTVISFFVKKLLNKYFR